MEHQSAFDTIHAAACAGAEWAWARLVDEFDPTLCAYVRFLGVEDVDTVMDATWAHVAREVRSFEGTEVEFRSWVLTVAHHTATDVNSGRSVASLDPGRVTTIPPEKRLSFDALRHAIELLPVAEREVALLRFVMGLDIDQTMTVTGRGRRSVTGLQRRALRRLDVLLEGRYETLASTDDGEVRR